MPSFLADADELARTVPLFLVRSYVDNWLPFQDFQILARTVGQVLKGTRSR